jgi:hypothetical protein
MSLNNRYVELICAVLAALNKNANYHLAVIKQVQANLCCLPDLNTFPKSLLYQGKGTYNSTARNTTQNTST